MLERLLDQLGTFLGAGLTNLLAAILILIVGYVVARLISQAVVALLRRTNLDNRLARTLGRGEGETGVEQATGTLVFYLLMLFVLVAFLDRLALRVVTDPLNALLVSVLAFIPKAIGAAIILLVGYVLATLVRTLVTNIAAGLGADSLGERVGLTTKLSGLLGTIVYALILIPSVIAALNALELDAVSGPATAMLQRLLTAIPAIFGAAVLLGLTYFVGRIVAGLVTDILTGVGFNDMVGRMGLARLEQAARTPAQLVGTIVLVAIMLFAATEAAELLGFDIVAEIIAEFILIGGRVLVALVVMGIGVYLANLAQRLVAGSGTASANMLATLARWTIIIFAGAMALKQLGIADDIVNLAFGLTLGAVAVAAALAFGLGSRDIAGREVEKLLAEIRNPADDVAGTD